MRSEYANTTRRKGCNASSCAFEAEDRENVSWNAPPSSNCSLPSRIGLKPFGGAQRPAQAGRRAGLAPVNFQPFNDGINRSAATGIKTVPIRWRHGFGRWSGTGYSAGAQISDELRVTLPVGVVVERLFDRGILLFWTRSAQWLLPTMQPRGQAFLLLNNCSNDFFRESGKTVAEWVGDGIRHRFFSGWR